MAESYLTVHDVAEVLKVNQQTVRNWIDRGELAAVAAGQGARVAVVRGRSDRFGGRADVLRVRDAGMTTQSLVDCERRLIDVAAGGAEEGRAIVPSGAIDGGLASANRPLTGEQERVVRG